MKNVSVISSILTYVPVNKPIIPNTTNSPFLIKRHLQLPIPGRSQYVIVSIIAGNIRPNVLKQTAPISVMNGPRFGMIIATITVKVWKKKLTLAKDFLSNEERKRKFIERKNTEIGISLSVWLSIKIKLKKKTYHQPGY